jgi:hypothetical protein
MNLVLNEHTVVDMLLDPAQRDALLAAMRAEHGTRLPLTNRYEVVAPRADATPEQLRAVMAVLTRPDRRYDALIAALTFHPQMPEEILLHLAEQDCCVVALAHRPEPRALLEYIAHTYGIDEAISTLALNYYSADSLEAFTAFITRHQAEKGLRWRLARATHLTAAQRAVVQVIVGDATVGRPVRSHRVRRHQ